jgi:hypothetical protein
LFASTTDEWVSSLLRLIDDPAYRALVGRRGHARVRESFSVESNAPRLAELIRDPAGASLSPV